MQSAKGYGLFWVALSFGPSCMIHEKVGFCYFQNSTVSDLMGSMTESPWVSLRPRWFSNSWTWSHHCNYKIYLHGMILRLCIQICSIQTLPKAWWYEQNNMHLFPLRFSRCHQLTPRWFSWFSWRILQKIVQSCRFGIDLLIFICHEAVLLEERPKWAKPRRSFEQISGEMIPFIMLDHMWFHIIYLELISNEIKSDEVKSNHSFRSFTQIIHWSFSVCCPCGHFQGLIICSLKAWTLRWWPSRAL